MKSDASSHYGKVNLKSGNIVLKNNQVAGGTFVLDMTSINATDVAGEEQQKLNGHLKMVTSLKLKNSRLQALLLIL